MAGIGIYRYLKKSGLLNEEISYSDLTNKKVELPTKKFCTSPKCCQYVYYDEKSKQKCHRTRAKVEKEALTDTCPDCGYALVVKVLRKNER